MNPELLLIQAFFLLFVLALTAGICGENKIKSVIQIYIKHVYMHEGSSPLY